uniref:SCP domain-containing protein n=1 Tax=Strongyloides venezuelensis TaxID=75913 RepID=A0A0K0FIX0_STRVS
MLSTYYTINLILFILIAPTVQLIVIPYLTRLKNGNKYVEYKGHIFKSLSDIVNIILKEKFSEGIESICIYHAGLKKEKKVFKIFSFTCESILKYRFPHYGSIEFDVMYPNSVRQNAYYCGNDVEYSFMRIIDYALKNHCYIKFRPRYFRPTPPPLHFCISTLHGRLCLMRTSLASEYWRRLWSDCDRKCFYGHNFVHPRLKYLLEFNHYRKGLWKKSLVLSGKLGLSATARAEKMAREKKLLSISKKSGTELVFYAPDVYGIYLPRIILEYLFDKNINSRKVSSHKKILAVLLDGDQEHIGFGFAKSGNGVYICIQLSKSLRE